MCEYCTILKGMGEALNIGGFWIPMGGRSAGWGQSPTHTEI